MKNTTIKNVLICGETYSDNYGDGVIAHCLSYACKKINKDITVKHIDMSFRKKYYDKSVVNDDVKSNTGYLKYYVRLKRLFGWITVRKNFAANEWLDDFKRSDLIIIGGGQLFMDYELGFPLKMYVISSVAKLAGSNVCCVACGVSSSMSFLGKLFFGRILLYSKMKNISVRDINSNINLIKYFPSLKSKTYQVCDPAVFSKDAYGVINKTRGNVVGLNIMHFKSLLKVVPNCSGFEEIALKKFWSELIQYLSDNKYTINIFTNGDMLDDQFLSDVLECVGSKNIENIKIPMNPDELVSCISECDVVVAHRLHANIISYALGIPSVGLVWDDKVYQFGNQTKRSEFYIEPVDQSSENVYDHIVKAFSNEFDGSLLSSMQNNFLSTLEQQFNEAV